MFLPVAEALIARLFFSPATEAPPISENNNLLRQAEAWVSGEPWQAPAPPAAAPGVFVGGELSPELAPELAPELSPELSPELGPELGPELAPDLVGEPWKDYHDLVEDDWAAAQRPGS